MIKLSKFCEDDVISFNLKGETKDEIYSQLVELRPVKMVKNKGASKGGAGAENW
jgi:hypothetical protein